jgi:hypothetical protein
VSYQRQHRGDATAYAAYFAGMDRSVQQKLAYTTAHFPAQGAVVDMGSGSGLGTFQLAQLHPHLKLIGVDINPVSVAHARETYQLPNLRYLEGDIGAPLFAPGSLDGILDSSVFHHLTSFNGFDVAQVQRALAVQAEALREGGVMVIRDFVIGRGPELLLLDVHDDDGAREGQVPQLSTAALFERFARDFRSSVNPDWPVPFKELAAPCAGLRRFKLARRAAAEFLLRKDYRDHWAEELLEEYTYFTQEQFERELGRLGFRVLVSQEVHNPWIVEHRFRGKVQLLGLDGEPLGFPPTNFVIVGEKVSARSGVRLREAIQRRAEQPAYLSMAVHRNAETGARYELVRRPHQTLDLLPWFEREGRVQVVARQGFPRPVLIARPPDSELGGVELAGYVSEPLTAIADQGTGQEAVARLLGPWITARRISEPMTFFPSPGGVNERVVARWVELASSFERRATVNTTPFASAGELRELDAHQLLRASQVGGLFDARLELLVYCLLLERGAPLEPWIGALPQLTPRPVSLPIVAARAALEARRPRSWLREEGAPISFLELRASDFVEESADGQALRTARFEYVVPRALSATTLALLPVIAGERDVWVGVERRELPAVGEWFDSSELAVAPAWRLPREVRDLPRAEAWVRERLRAEHGVEAGALWQLGGRYFPSSGVTPEVVYPYLCEIEPTGAAAARWSWTSLRELVAERQRIHDGHLLSLVFRAAHALGIL